MYFLHILEASLPVGGHFTGKGDIKAGWQLTLFSQELDDILNILWTRWSTALFL
jgi:hypothetical protein